MQDACNPPGREARRQGASAWSHLPGSLLLGLVRDAVPRHQLVEDYDADQHVDLEERRAVTRRGGQTQCSVSG